MSPLAWIVHLCRPPLPCPHAIIASASPAGLALTSIVLENLHNTDISCGTSSQVASRGEMRRWSSGKGRCMGQLQQWRPTPQRSHHSVRCGGGRTMMALRWSSEGQRMPPWPPMRGAASHGRWFGAKATGEGQWIQSAWNKRDTPDSPRVIVLKGTTFQIVLFWIRRE